MNFFGGIAQTQEHENALLRISCNNSEALESYLRQGFIRNWNAQWATLVNLKGLRSLKLNECSWLHVGDVEKISQISDLESLDLNMSKSGSGWIGDNCLKHISDLRKLKWLDLTRCNDISGLGFVKHLGQMKNLEYLNISKCGNISPSRLQELKDLLPNTRIFS